VAAGLLDVNLVVADVPTSPDELTALLAERGAASAWVTGDPARSEGSAQGNALERLIARTPRVAHLPVVAPLTGIRGAFERFLALAASADLRVVRVCPAAQHFPLASWVLSPLPEACADAGIALMIDFAPRPPDWRGVLNLARDHPALPLIVTGLDGSERFALPALLDAAPNVVVDAGPLSAYQLTERIAS
jgi:hypothetical protein